MTIDTTPSPNAPYEEVYVEIPQWPKTVGIFSIVWGSLGTCCGVLGTGWFIAMPSFLKMAEQQNGPAPAEMMPTPGYIASMGAGVLVTIVLIIAGILTLQRSISGRFAHLAYSVLSIAVTLVGTYFGLQYNKGMREWVAQNPGNAWAAQAGGQSQNMNEIFGYAITALALIWPLFCLVWFGLVKRSHASMTGLPEADPMASLPR
jgi:hypothetical protein